MNFQGRLLQSTGENQSIDQLPGAGAIGIDGTGTCTCGTTVGRTGIGAATVGEYGWGITIPGVPMG